MTRDQKIDITLEELDREITIATYQENRVRKCLAAAFSRIESETEAGGGEMPLPSSIMNIDIQAAGKDSVAVVKALYAFYVSDVRYSEEGQGLPVSEAENGLHGLIEWHLDHATKIEAENLLVDAMADYEQQGFINGFRYATAIWKVC